MISHEEKLIARNTLLNLIGQALPLLVGVFAIPSIIRGLGTDRFGILTLAWMVIGYFNLFDLGLGRALTQVVATRLGKNKPSEFPGLVWTALAIMTAMGFLGAIVAWNVSPFLTGHVFKMPEALRPETLNAFYVLSASVPIVILSSGFGGVLTAYQRFDLINLVRVPLGLTNFIIPLLVLPFSASLVPIILLLVISRLIACVAQYYFCLRVMSSLRGKKRFVPRTIMPLLNLGGWMTLSNIIGPLMVSLDRFIIGAVISVTAVAYYATPYEMITKLWIVSGALIVSLFPAFAAGKSSDPNGTVRLLSKSTGAIFFSIFPVVLAIVTFSREGLMFWLGKDFSVNSSPVLQWLAAGVFISCFSQIFFALIQGRGRPDITAKIHLIELFIYFPVLWWALKRYGIVGAAFVWTLRVALDGFLLFWASQRLMPLAGKIILKLSLCLVIASGALAICGFPESVITRSVLFCVVSLILVIVGFPYLQRNQMLTALSLKSLVGGGRLSL